MLKSVHIEVGDGGTRQLVREHVLDLIRCVGKYNVFEAQLTEVMKKYRKGFRELKMKERQKMIDMMARE
eukprot:1134407-Ditylum_brightwellii.AAC.1